VNADRPPGAGTLAGSDWGFRAILVAACLALYLLGTAGQSVFDRDEARFALAVKEMSQRGDWLVPSNFGEPRYNKPVLCYWLALASTRVLGMNEAALRLPSALCCILTVLVTMSIAQRLGGRRVARIAGVAIATALYLVIEARSLTADASLLAATTLSFWAWMRVRESPPAPFRWQLLFWAALGAGLLAKVVNFAFLGSAACALAVLEGSYDRRRKAWLAAVIALGALATAIPGFGAVGPVMLGTLGLVLLSASLRSQDARSTWRQLGAAWGVPLALVIFLAWGVPAAIATHGGFLAQGLGHHLLGRTATPYEGHSGWPGYYLLATLLAFFPWGSFLPSALRHAWGQRRDPAMTLLLAWVLGPLVLVELTTSKLPHYMLVTFPALAVLVALLIDARVGGNRAWTPAERRFEAGLFALACAFLVAAGVYVHGQFESSAIRVPAMVLAGVAAAVGAAATTAWLPGRRRVLTAVLACGAAAIYLSTFALLLPALETERLSPRLGATVTRYLRGDDRLVLCKVGEASVGFYLPRTPDFMGDAVAVTAYLRGRPGRALVLAPADDRGLPSRLQAGDTARWQLLDTVDGLILPSLSARRIQVFLRDGTASAGP
jgi:4-amino-4-deoxy-L-arabinose transferase-like glycosyltransferase